jgi:hypothetical protein
MISSFQCAALSFFISRLSKLAYFAVTLNLILLLKYKKQRDMKRIRFIPVELIFWVLALTLLATANPHEHHFTLCPLANLGFDWCPGCGLGRSITAIFNTDFSASIRHHWFGIPALLIILYRIYQLSKQFIFKQKHYLNYKEI